MPAAFFGGLWVAATMLASISVPFFSIRPLASSCRLISAKQRSSTPASAAAWRKRQIVVSSGVALIEREAAEAAERQAVEKRLPPAPDRRGRKAPAGKAPSASPAPDRVLREAVVAAAVGRSHDRRARHRSGRRRLHRAQRSRRRHQRRARHDGLRRVLSLLQFLPRRLGAAARVSVLRRGPRAAHHRSRHPRVDGLLRVEDPRRLHARRRDPRRDRRGDRRRGGDRLQRADPLRPAHVVGRRGRHDRSHPARRAGVAGARRRRHAASSASPRCGSACAR